MLSDSDSNGDEVHKLTINEHYAKAFQRKKEREELAKLEEKYGSEADENDDVSETDSEDDESEDEHGEELTPAVDAAILRTLAKIKRKDPDIYNAQKDVFDEEQNKIAELKTARKPKDKSKPVTIRQAALESALHTASRSPSPAPLTHVEEQHALREEMVSHFRNAVAAEDDDEDTLLVPREKTKGEVEEEDEEYREFLKREVGDDLHALVTVQDDPFGVWEASEDEPKGRKKTKLSKSNKTDRRDADHEFLMNYILNRGWIDRSARHVPTYGEAVASSSDDGEFDEDEFEEIAEDFEASFNFRFEEPGAAVVKTYPRHIPLSVRPEDTSRKEARERKKARKQEKLLKKREEMQRLKRLKMKEIWEKLERVGREGGKNLEDSEALQNLDLDGDWDPDAHDRDMAKLYGDGDKNVDVEKPHWDEEIDIGDIVETPDPPQLKKKKKKNEEYEEDGVDVSKMDADVEHVEEDEDWDGTEEMRKRKLDEYMDEVYALGFNDIVGDIPTRFKYTTVESEAFGLSPVDILLSSNTELNQYISVKKYAPYRKKARWDPQRGERLKELRNKLKERGADYFGPDNDEAGKLRKSRKGKKERMKAKEAGAET